MPGHRPDNPTGLSVAREEVSREAAGFQPVRSVTASEAAEYLGLDRSTIRYHLYTSKRLKPVGKRGLNNIFSRADLDALRSPRARRGTRKPQAR